MSKVFRYKVGQRFFNSLPAAKLYAKQQGLKVMETDAFVEKQVNKLEKQENSLVNKFNKFISKTQNPKKKKTSSFTSFAKKQAKSKRFTPAKQSRSSFQKSDSDRFNDFFS